MASTAMQHTTTEITGTTTAASISGMAITNETQPRAAATIETAGMVVAMVIGIVGGVIGRVIRAGSGAVMDASHNPEQSSQQAKSDEVFHKVLQTGPGLP
jgi:hypothetical protein